MVNPVNGFDAVPGTGAVRRAGLDGQELPGAQEAAEGDVSFQKTLEKALGDVEGMQDSANDAISAFLRGEDVELHQVMAAAEEAGIALEMLVQTRNRIVRAYRTLTSMSA